MLSFGSHVIVFKATDSNAHMHKAIHLPALPSFSVKTQPKPKAKGEKCEDESFIVAIASNAYVVISFTCSFMRVKRMGTW